MAVCSVNFENKNCHHKGVCGILSEKQTNSVLEYYQRKGKHDLFEIAQQNLSYKSEAKVHSKEVQLSAVKKHQEDPARKHQESILPDGQVVKVYNCRNTKYLKFQLARSGSTPSGDVTVNEAYDGAVATYNFFKKIFKFKSIDGHNFPLISSVHFQRYYNNAFWNGQQMVYGDGDGKVFNRFTISIDITGHEQTHGLTQERAGINLGETQGGIDYEKESGGINESYSDIYGIMIKQFKLNQTAAQSDWLIGAGLIKKGAKGLRSMTNPGSAFQNHPALGNDTQLSRYPDYLEAESYGEVDPHDSSGIPNKAFSHMAINLGGYAWEKAGKVFFDILPNVKHDIKFAELANLTLERVKEVYGEASPEYKAFMEGWRLVEVLV